jgi:hypothetical protein
LVYWNRSVQLGFVFFANFYRDFHSSLLSINFIKKFFQNSLL